MSFFEDTKKIIDFDTISYLVRKLREENQNTYMSVDNFVSSADIESIFGPEPKNYLTIEALEDGLTVSLSMNACEYCIDEDNNWVTLAADTPSPSLNTGQTISFRGNLIPSSKTPRGIGTFTISKKCNVLGNVMSMLFGDDTQSNFSLSGMNCAFYNLFYNCSNIISAKDLYLPATTLANQCYQYMFAFCTSLTTAPELPATTLYDECYVSMFDGCTSLTTAPELPATTLAEHCYQNMFRGCTSLTTAPELPATELTDYCYQSMFRGCTSLTTAPELPATTLADYCYYSMFSGCKSLTTAPELPATNLAEGCYGGMFSNCTSLTTAPELPATTLVERCYENMFTGCTSLTTAPELPATTLAPYCYGSMFESCTSLETAPKLPATTLANWCYIGMFEGCTSLTTAPELPATTLGWDCYWQMFASCTKLQVVTKSEFIAFNDIDSGFEGTLKDCYMPKNQNVIINLSDSDEVIFNYSGGIYSALREEIILSDILSQEDISTLTPEYDLVVTVYDNYPDPHIVNTPNICEHITWEAGQSLEEFAEKFNFDYNHTSISILYTSRKGGDYYYYYD